MSTPPCPQTPSHLAFQTPSLSEGAPNRAPTRLGTQALRAKARVPRPLVSIRALHLLCLIPCLALALLTLGAWQLSPTNQPQPRFTHYDVFVDHGDPGLAAYQVQIRFSANVTLVGIEGGEHPGFAEPPYYDPAALHNPRESRVILAAFTTGADVPAIKTRVARVHVQITGDAPRAEITLITAANPAGEPIDAVASLSAGDNK